MKAQRVFRKISGVLCLFVVIALTVISVGLMYVAMFPDLSQKLSNLFSGLSNGFTTVAGYWGMTSIVYLLPLMFYVVPALLLLVGGILLVMSKRNASTIAGSVLALIGIAPITVFSTVCAAELFDNYATVFIAVNVALLALFVIAIGCTLGLIPKKAAKKASEQVESQEEPQEELLTDEQQEQEYTVSDVQPMTFDLQTDEQPQLIVTEPYQPMQEPFQPTYQFEQEQRTPECASCGTHDSKGPCGYGNLHGCRPAGRY